MSIGFLSRGRGSILRPDTMDAGRVSVILDCGGWLHVVYLPQVGAGSMSDHSLVVQMWVGIPLYEPCGCSIVGQDTWVACLKMG